MTKYDANEIFVPGGMPEHTYNPREKFQLEDRLKSTIRRTSKFISVTGRTKSGKTVLVNRLLPRGGKNLWFDGGTFSTETDFWQDICDQTDSFTGLSLTDGESRGINGELEASANLGFFASLKARLSTFIHTSKSEQRTRSLPPKTAALRGLRKKRLPLVIDDFHYLSRGDQKSIVRALKSLAFDGIVIILIAIPHRKFDVLKSERELLGRVEQIEIPPWEPSELITIAEKGFPLLNVRYKHKDLESLAAQAYGSPHLMQEFSVNLCERSGIESTTTDPFELNLDPTTVQALFRDVAELTGKPVYDKLRRGPRARKDRIMRELQDGSSTDIYGVVLRALSEIKPAVETLHIQRIRDAVREVIKSKPPTAHEISLVLDHMSRISMDDNASSPVIDWEKDESLLHVTDPFFAFFLKWGTIDLGLTGRDA